ncbi:hypothetical protein GE09DRAFT_1125088 [Coniochaeta sp. 2T2.1]|nr:hypothetical protein GE09DRAFT_1125088 [Coniochaeta sp. 2T2.1]
MASPLANLIHHTDATHSVFTPATPSLGAQVPLGPPPSIRPPLAPMAASPPLTIPNSAGSPAAASQGPRSHSTTQSLYQCADCLKRYSRPEHLQRHIATHTLGKRFQCDVCSKAFSRADLLKRHRTNHSDDNGTKRRRISSSPGAGRVAHACQACAKARVKCEETKPCTRCKNRSLNCEYGSSEDAAMHLLHLSATARTSELQSPQGHLQEHASPDTGYSTPQLPLGAPPPAYHTQVNPQLVAQTPSLTNNQSLRDEPQLLTPDTMMDHSSSDNFQQPYPNHAMLDVAKLPFSDFLRDVLYEQSLGDQTRYAEAQGLAVLDFCDDANLELNDIDFGLLDHWNIDGNMFGQDPNAALQTSKTQEPPPDLDKMRQRLVQIWTKSPWRFNPEKTDTGFNEQGNLPLPSRDAGAARLHSRQVRQDHVIEETLYPASRDKILAIVLSTCRNDNMMSRVASSFPSAEVMDSWVHIFLASHMCQVSSFIHYPSFSLNTQWPEWLAMAASAGAVLAPIPTLRRFGFALQEAVRITVPSRFEENNKTIADISLVQALMMVQDVGLWSGNRRKMEIAECHLNIPIAMMRYRGKFQRSHYPQLVIEPTDEGKVLEEKWKKWSELEAWKRLVYHAYLRDAQVSMTQFNNMSMSYAELTLPLPCSKELWFAKTAEEFKERYLEAGAGEGKRAPSLGDLLRDIKLLTDNHRKLDMQFAISVYLHGFWALIWEYRQMNSVFRVKAETPSYSSTANLLLSSRHQELCQMLQNFQLVVPEWRDALSAQEGLVLHLLQLDLHVSLDDLQLFAGKEGDDQARRIYPTLQKWSDSTEARQALWHAGQILRQAKLFPTGHLKDFYAIAVHHAALCLWAHGVVTKATHRNSLPAMMNYETVYLDGEDSAAAQRFVGFGHGRAAICGPQSLDSSAPVSESLVTDPKSCMEVAQEILRANFIDGQEGLPPISDNIIHLLKQLGNAAWAVGLG